MPKFLVHQVLPDGGDLMRDHLQPGAKALASQLRDPASADVTWLWGCADLDRMEWLVLFEADRKEAVEEVVAVFPGIERVSRVLFATEENLARILLDSIGSQSTEA